MFEGGNDLIGHFVMMGGDVMEYKVGGGVNNAVLAKDADFGIAELFFTPAASDGDEGSFKGPFIHHSGLAIMGNGWKVGVGRQAFVLVIIQILLGDIRHRVGIRSIPPVPIAVGKITRMVAAIIGDGKEAMGPELFDQPFFRFGGLERVTLFEPAEVQGFGKIPRLDVAVFVRGKVWVIGHEVRRT